MSRTDELRAELALAESEEAWVAAKAARDTPAVQKARTKLRSARAELREALAAAPDISEIKADVLAKRRAARQAREG